MRHALCMYTCMHTQPQPCLPNPQNLEEHGVAAYGLVSLLQRKSVNAILIINSSISIVVVTVTLLLYYFYSYYDGYSCYYLSYYRKYTCTHVRIMRRVA